MSIPLVLRQQPQAEPKADDTIAATIEGFESVEAAPAPAPETPPEPTQPEYLPADPRRNPAARRWKIGDRVKLTHSRQDDSVRAPRWGGDCGFVGGTVTEVFRGPDDDGCLNVKWDNGETGVFYYLDLSECRQPVSIPEQTEPEKPKTERVPRVEGDWPANAKENREGWLTEAARRIAADPAELADVLFSVGFGKGGTRGASNYSVVENRQGGGHQVFIRPNVDKKADAANAVGRAMMELGVTLHPPGTVNLPSWPDYPQPDVAQETKSQATRLVKCQCEACGYTVRTTKRWLDRSGAPLCPHVEHTGRAMVVRE